MFLRLILVFLLSFPFAAMSESISFFGDSEVSSTTGYYTLSWSNEDQQEIKVEQANDKSFQDNKLIYLGTGKSVFVSGLLDGDYFFRIFAADSPVIDTIHLKVKQKNKYLAYTIFFFGLSAFLLIIHVIFKGEYAN